MLRTVMSIFSRERLPLIGISLLVLLASMVIGTFAPASPELVQQAQDLVDKVNQYGPLYILFNNGIAMVLMMVPLLGLGEAVMSSYVTGAAISSVSSLAGIDPRIGLIFSVLMPHALMEFGAYSLAMAENLALCQRLLTRKDLHKEIGYFIATLFVSVLLLAIAMIVEVATVNILGGSL